MPLWCALLLALAPSLASADEAGAAAQVRRQVETGLLAPLADAEQARSRFSRARPVPRARRVRVTRTETALDKAGHAFLAFAVDVRFGNGDWRQDHVGCAYPESGALFVKVGPAYRPASFLLGKNAAVAADVCQP